MVRRPAAGIAAKLGNRSFRATGITAYLKNGGSLEKAAAMTRKVLKLALDGRAASGQMSSVSVTLLPTG